MDFEFAKWYNSIPRISITTLSVVQPELTIPSTFDDIEKHNYHMSLLFMVAAIVLICFILLLISSINACCMCCKEPEEPQKSGISCQKTFIYIFALCILGFSVLGISASVHINLQMNSVQSLLQRLSNFNESSHAQINLTKSLVVDVNETVNIISAITDDESIDSSESDFAESEFRTDLLNFDFSLYHEYVRNTITVPGKVMESLKYFVKTFEVYRFYITLGLLIATIFVGMYVGISLCCASQVNLIIGAVCAMLTLLTCCFLIISYLIMGIIVSDVCVDANAYVLKALKNDTYYSYYLTCSSPTQNAPETVTRLAEAERDFEKSYKTYSNSFTNDDSPGLTSALKKLQKEYNRLETALTGLQTDFECNQFHENYVYGQQVICYGIVGSMSLILLSAVIICLSLFLAAILSGCVSGHLDNRRQKYYERTDDDRYGVDYFQAPLESLDDSYRPRSSQGPRYKFGRSAGPRAGPAFNMMGDEGGVPPPSYQI